MDVTEIKTIVKQQFPELIQYAAILDNPFVLSMISMLNIDMASFNRYSKPELAKKLRNIADALEK